MKYVWTLVLAVGISALIGGVVYSAIPKTAFVDNIQLFEAFQGRKELENRLEQDNNKKQVIIDSLELQIKAVQQQAQTDEAARKRFYFLQQKYQELNQVNQREYQEKSQEYTEAIWKQISQYAREYGKENGYDYVFGIAGQGSLMYGKPHYDITEEVIAYINQKYAGN